MRINADHWCPLPLFSVPVSLIECSINSSSQNIPIHPRINPCLIKAYRDRKLMFSIKKPICPIEINLNKIPIEVSFPSRCPNETPIFHRHKVAIACFHFSVIKFNIFSCPIKICALNKLNDVKRLDLTTCIYEKWKVIQKVDNEQSHEINPTIVYLSKEKDDGIAPRHIVHKSIKQTVKTAITFLRFLLDRINK